MDRIAAFTNLMDSDRNISRASTNYNRLMQFYDSGQFTSDNEVFQQLQYAKNTRDFNRLYAAALQRQQEINDYNRQLADNAALRDEQRAYEDPRAQIARERAAGLNPDLLDGAGLQAPSSPITAPDIDAAQVPALSDPAETFGLVMQGLSTVSSVFSGLAGGLNSFLQFSQGAATMGDVVSGIKSDAKLKQTAADLASGLKPYQISAAESASRSAEVAADVAEGTSAAQQATSLASAASQRLQLVGTLASQFTTADFASDEVLGQAVADYLGLSLDDPQVQPLLRQLKRYNGSPQMQKQYQEAMIAHKEQMAKNAARPYDMVLEFETTKAETDLFQQRADHTAARFESVFNRLSLTDENAQKVASGLSSDISAQQATSQLDEQQALKDLQLYQDTLGHQAAELAKIDKELEAMKSNPKLYDPVSYNALVLKRTSIALLQAREMHRVNSLIQDFYYTQSMSIMRSGGIGITPADEYVLAGHKAYYRELFNPTSDVSLPEADVKGKFKNIITLIPQLRAVAKLL